MAPSDTYKALVVDQRDGKTSTEIRDLSDVDLPEGEVTVRIDYSSFNYKDGLALTGSAPVIRNFPMTAGIDFAGTVVAADGGAFSPGDKVVLTGWGVGERHPGGFAQKARVKAAWLEMLPDGMNSRHAMAIGTAGLTAMLCVHALEAAGVTTDGGAVLVTGAAGGVGSVAVALLAGLGYSVTAVTGRASCHDYLKGLGATEVLGRDALAGAPERPLLKERWAGAVDSVGGDMLSQVLAETRYGGAVAACGLAGGTGLKTTVLPFILRGVNLLGIDSVMCPSGPRQAAWARLAQILPESTLAPICEVVGLADLPARAPEILKGGVRGRLIVDVNA